MVAKIAKPKENYTPAPAPVQDSVPPSGSPGISVEQKSPAPPESKTRKLRAPGQGAGQNNSTQQSNLFSRKTVAIIAAVVALFIGAAIFAPADHAKPAAEPGFIHLRSLSGSTETVLVNGNSYRIGKQWQKVAAHASPVGAINSFALGKGMKTASIDFLYCNKQETKNLSPEPIYEAHYTDPPGRSCILPKN